MKDSCSKWVPLLAVLWLAGCAAPAPRPKPAPAPAPAPKPAEPRRATPEQIRQRAIAYFLGRAEEAQRQGYLIYPAGASAYDFYLNVNQLDPGNRRAAGGIQTIVIDLVERARDALRRRSFAEVNSFLQGAEQLAPGNPLVAEVRVQMAKERSRAAEAPSGGEPLALPAGPLAARADSVVELLHGAARRIRSEELRVIIVARDDAEGRWIYQQLREAVPGYRVRGDIKLGSPPRLLLSKPAGGGGQ